MKFTSKESNSEEVFITGTQILEKMSMSDIDSYDRKWRDPGLKIILNSPETNIINSDLEYDTVEMLIVPFEEITIRRCKMVGNTLVAIEPIRVQDLRKKDTDPLFNFANGYLTCLKQLIA